MEGRESNKRSVFSGSGDEPTPSFGTSGNQDNFPDNPASVVETVKRQRLGDAAGSSDIEATDEVDTDSGPARVDEVELGAPEGTGVLVNVPGKPPVHRGPGKIGAQHPYGTDVAKPEKPVQVIRNRASLRNTALRSVVKVFVMKCDPNYAQPWQMRPQRSSSGSAFVTCSKNRRILTNSHVVRFYTFHKMYAKHGLRWLFTSLLFPASTTLFIPLLQTCWQSAFVCILCSLMHSPCRFVTPPLSMCGALAIPKNGVHK